MHSLRQIIFCMAIFGVSSFAQGADYHPPYRSAYFLGRGDAGLAIADNEDAVSYNPAGIAFGTGIYKRLVLVSPMGEASQGVLSFAKDVQSASTEELPDILREHIGQAHHVGFYNFSGIVLRRVSLGIINSLTSDILIYKSPNNGALESVDASLRQTNGFTFSLAEAFFDQFLLLGATYKYLQRGEATLQADITSAQELQNLQMQDILSLGVGSGLDVGVMLRGKGRVPLSAGLTVLNVGNTEFSKFSSSSAPSELEPPKPFKQMVNVGMAIEPGAQLSRLKLLVDYWDLTSAVQDDPFKKIHIGSELSIQKIFGVTGGLSQGASSGGAYVDLRILRIDGGMYIEEVGQTLGLRRDRRYFVRLMAGF